MKMKFIRKIFLASLFLFSGIFANAQSQAYFSALEAYNSGDREAAYSQFRDLENDAAYYYLAILSEDSLEREANFKKAIALDPGNFWYKYGLASDYMGNRDTAKALEIFEELIEEYLDELQKYMPIDRQEFYDTLMHFVLFRTMQVLGAYGFRGYFEKKPHFLQSIPFAIENLRQLLQHSVRETVLRRRSRLHAWLAGQDPGPGQLRAVYRLLCHPQPDRRNETGGQCGIPFPAGMETGRRPVRRRRQHLEFSHQKRRYR